MMHCPLLGWSVIIWFSWTWRTRQLTSSFSFRFGCSFWNLGFNRKANVIPLLSSRTTHFFLTTIHSLLCKIYLRSGWIFNGTCHGYALHIIKSCSRVSVQYCSTNHKLLNWRFGMHFLYSSKDPKNLDQRNLASYNLFDHVRWLNYQAFES